MFCVIQFYLQLRVPLAAHKPFLKVAAIKLVIFFSFWQAFVIAILTSTTLNIIHPNDVVAYPDISVGIPALLTCVEMAGFAVMHIFAYPYKPYRPGSDLYKYPTMSDSPPSISGASAGPKQGGFLGLKAILDALNPWDMAKGFARGMRWIFVGRRHRKDDDSYKIDSIDVSRQPTRTADDISYQGGVQGLPIADEFRRSKFGIPSNGNLEEGAGLMSHAQPNPYDPTSHTSPLYTPARDRYDVQTGQELDSHRLAESQGIGMASSGIDDEQDWHVQERLSGAGAVRPHIIDDGRQGAHNALWGSRNRDARSNQGELDAGTANTWDR